MSEIIKIPFETEYFDPLSTLDCGQIFRFSEYNNGYKVFSMDKCAIIYLENGKTIIECNIEDKDYFYNLLSPAKSMDISVIEWHFLNFTRFLQVFL